MISAYWHQALRCMSAQSPCDHPLCRDTGKRRTIRAQCKAASAPCWNALSEGVKPHPRRIGLLETKEWLAATISRSSSVIGVDLSDRSHAVEGVYWDAFLSPRTARIAKLQATCSCLSSSTSFKEMCNLPSAVSHPPSQAITAIPMQLYVTR